MTAVTEAAIQTELDWWAAQPLDKWQPVGDNGSLAPHHGHDRDTPREFALSPALRVARKDYRAGVHACLRSFRVAYENRAHMTYTEGSSRWDGIEHDRRSIDGEYPHDCDCSACASWGGWDGLLFLLKKLATPANGDIFNGAAFRGGYTGTLVAHGEAVELGHTVPIDFILCGGTIWVPQHVVVSVGGGRVFSMGHQGDPGIYTIEDFQRELGIVAVRRYIASK